MSSPRASLRMIGFSVLFVSMLTAQSNYYFTIVNDSGGIYGTSISHHGEGVWQEGDRLSSSGPGPGEIWGFAVDPGVYDIEIDNQKGGACVIEGFKVSDSSRRLRITAKLLKHCRAIASDPVDGSPAPQSSVPANYQIVSIFFATDRLRGQNDGDRQEFAGERAPDEKLTLGSAEVSIPRDHRMGELEGPSLFRLEFRENPEKDVVLLKATVLGKDEFIKSLNNRLSGDPKKQVLVFVPGYNVTFEDGARRLGQITYDLGFAGAPILYSWPSSGTLWGYTADEATVEWSSPHLLSFLQTLQRNSDTQTIYLLGHSMGNRLIVSTLKSIADQGTPPDLRLREVIMAAPDIDAGVFKQIANPLRPSATQITIYESSKDRALEVSHTFHRYPRLGDTDPGIHVFKDYQCIEATSVDTGLIGHSYIGDSASILSDIFDLIRNGASANQRFRLTEHTLDGLPYWSFKK
jgi:esterase/lipase superfamily enzyme